MRHRVALVVALFALVLLGSVSRGQSEQIQVNDVKMLAGQWIGRAYILATILPTELNIKEDGSYSGHVANRPVAGKIRIEAGEPRYEGQYTRGRVGLYQDGDKRFLRAWAESGERWEYEEQK
jgi:hypothetical protein